MDHFNLHILIPRNPFYRRPQWDTGMSSPHKRNRLPCRTEMPINSRHKRYPHYGIVTRWITRQDHRRILRHSWGANVKKFSWAQNMLFCSKRPPNLSQSNSTSASAFGLSSTSFPYLSGNYFHATSTLQYSVVVYIAKCCSRVPVCLP